MTWFLIVSLSCTFIGAWLYGLEVIRRNVGRHGRWSELNEDQWTAVVLTLGGAAGLVISVLWKVLT